MKRNMILFSTLPIIFLFSIASGATLTDVWKDENYRGGPFKKVFVMAALPDPVIKSIIEDEVVRQLEVHWTDSVKSSTLFFSSHFISDKESITSKIRELKAEAVLVMKFIKVENEGIYVPRGKFIIPTLYYDWYSFYSSGFKYINTPAYKDDNYFALIETTIYDTKDEKLVWFARTSVEKVYCGCQEILPFIKVVINKLSSDQLIK